MGGSAIARPGRLLAVAALVLALLTAGTLLKPGGGETTLAVGVSGTTTAPPVSREVDGLQATLRADPEDPAAWAALGLAYVQQARLTADPGFYGRAEQAVATSRRLRPTGNAPALIGAASLAAGRHDFVEALQLVDQALALNAYDATAHGIRTDALTELGRYDEALTAVQRMVDLRPGLDSLARVSYSFELHNQVAAARGTLQRAARAATSPADRAFAEYYLGELAWNTGDLAAARQHYDLGLQADPTYPQLLEGRARTLHATGSSAAALDALQELTRRQPQPGYVLAYGELLEATGRPAEARAQYDVLRATQQLFAAQGVDVDVELSLFEADHGSPATAVATARNGYDRRPLSITAQDAYGWALHAAGRSAEALPLARQAVRLNSPQPALWYHLGAIHLALGNRVEARAALTRALSLNPQFHPLHAPKARNLLNTLR